MKSFYLLDADLELFEGGEGGASASGDSMGDTNTAGPTQPEPAANTRADKEGDVIVTSNTLDEKRKAYNDLIRGEYKDFYTQDTQRLIDRRFKETKQLEQRLNDQQGVMDMLMLRYGVEDVADLQAAIEDDDSYWEQAAMDAGMSVDQYKQFSKLERENKALLAAQQDRQNRELANQQLDTWYRDADMLAQKYDGFDIEAEVENPDFMRLLKAGVPMEHAYKTIHMDELMNMAAANASAAAERKTVENIRARGMRPTENGTSSQSTFVTKTDVHALSKKDRAEAVKRAARGEQITFT